ncbi:uncharacterized protein LOC111315181 [Durio zibethinus]|uniref:Uncharacterized protein LOC111315181 n=1 Tax=Durio zibethinus TaxID=66656 RepID=A0A6P6B6H9_DURZI|nr:uncharacterized protein LOC111315181 [Durio zibethinus]
MVKINLDGSFSHQGRTGGTEIIIRDQNGGVLGAAAICIDKANDPFQVEASAAVRALNFAKEMGFTKIMLEEDCLTVIRKLKEMEQDLSPIGTVIEEAKWRMSRLHECHVMHLLRSGNMVAHQLACYSLHLANDEYRLEDYSNVISAALHGDCNQQDYHAVLHVKLSKSVNGV